MKIGDKVVSTVISRQDAIDKIRNSKGKVFSALVKTRSGSLRRFVARTEAKTGQAGQAPSYNFAEKGLISVLDMEKTQESGKPEYRAIACEGIMNLRIGGNRYEVQ